MTDRPLIFTSGVAGVVNLTGSTEAVVATCAGVVTRFSGQTLKLNGFAVVTTGTTTTAVVVRIRQLSLTGTQVSPTSSQTVITAAGDSNAYPCYATDSPGDVTGYAYVLTVQQTGGGTGGATVYAVLECRCD